MIFSQMLLQFKVIKDNGKFINSNWRLASCMTNFMVSLHNFNRFNYSRICFMRSNWSICKDEHITPSWPVVILNLFKSCTKSSLYWLRETRFHFCGSSIAWAKITSKRNEYAHAHTAYHGLIITSPIRNSKSFRCNVC